MSNVYILEPPTSGKVLLKTSVGDIDVELWAKETPKACRNFIQLCLEGYYDNTIFHRVVKGFIVQGGDPKGDGTGGDSIYGAPFKDEFHQRLKFTRRGLLAMANGGKDDNSSQFFFTLGPTPELQNKHTIFGKVTGETIYNMLKLEEGLIEDETPVYPHKVLKIEVLNNPFPDIEPRLKEVQVKEKKKKEKKPGVKNFKLLSFGQEAEDDEEQSIKVNEQFSGKGKSTHDILDDPKLSSQTVEIETNKGEDTTGRESPEIDPAEQLEKIRNKLKSGEKRPVKSLSTKTPRKQPREDDEDFSSDDDVLNKKKQKMEEIKKEIKSVKQEYHKNKLNKKDEKKVETKKDEKEEENETVKAYKEEYDVYKKKQKSLPKKGAGREEYTLDLLEKFKTRLHSVKESQEEENRETEIPLENDDVDIDNDESWMQHKLHFKDDTPVLAKDANTKDDDWFEIYDPRNPLNKRRRGESSNKSNTKPKK